MSKDRVYSEQEVAEIMRRAVALQEQAKESGSPYRPGVTQDELQRAAKEMGVDPAFLEQAVREKLEGKPSKLHGLLQEEQRVVEGELDPNDFDIVLEQVRSVNSRRHPMTQVGRSLRGQAFTGAGLARLEVTSRGGRTRINLKPLPIFEVLGTFYPAFIVSMAAGASLAEHGMAGLATAVAGGAFGVAFLACRAWLAKSRQATSRLADKLQGVVSEHIDDTLRKNISNAPPTAREQVDDQHLDQT